MGEVLAVRDVYVPVRKIVKEEEECKRKLFLI